jgi:hypothetical protein
MRSGEQHCSSEGRFAQSSIELDEGSPLRHRAAWGAVPPP